MKILLALLMIFIIGIVIANGAFVVDAPETDRGLLVITDAELSWKAGGNVYIDKRSQKFTAGSGAKANCNDVSNCPQGSKVYNIPRAQCKPCTSNTPAYRMSSGSEEKKATKLTSWCSNVGYEGERCMYKTRYTNKVHQCTISLGTCP